jgi:hypothetical protein
LSIPKLVTLILVESQVNQFPITVRERHNRAVVEAEKEFKKVDSRRKRNKFYLFYLQQSYHGSVIILHSGTPRAGTIRLIGWTNWITAADDAGTSFFLFFVTKIDK